MKRVISFIGPFVFLATILLCMNSFKHVHTLSVVEEATIEMYLATFEEEKKLGIESKDEDNITPNIQEDTLDEQ